MKQLKATNLRSVLACLVLVGGAGSAAAQVTPDDPTPTPPPSDGTGPADDLPDPLTPNPTAPDPSTTDPSTYDPSTTAPTSTEPAPVVVTPPPVENTHVLVVQPEEEKENKRFGAALSLGGGVSQFTDSSMRDTAGMAGFWDLRGHFGLRSPLGFEVAYLGSASDITPRLGTASDATLLGNGVEAVARFNLITDSVVEPYLFGGAAWKHYEVTGSDFSTSASGIADSDDVLEIPVGAGLSYRMSGLFADARFTFRGATNEDLVIGTPDDSAEDDFLSDEDAYLPMHNWPAGARIGYEF
jgi:opacity protein-like surface antigen